MLNLREAKDPTELHEPPRIALAVAGGGPLGGIYEIGVLRALEDCIAGLDLTELDSYVGVSSGAFVAAGLANGINSAQMARIFINSESVEHPFKPEMFLRPAYSEYGLRLRKLPGASWRAMKSFARNPLAVMDTISEFADVVPAGFFDNRRIADFLEGIFTSGGRSNDFRELRHRLCIVATDLDTGEAVRFGQGHIDHVSIARAVQASSALPVLFPPVEIDGHHYVDGALRRTLHASVALERGCDLLLAINPLVPFNARLNRHPGLQPQGLVHSGLNSVLSQTFRAMIQSRMRVGMERYAQQYQHTDFLLLEPNADDTRMFFTNVFSYADRRKLCEHAYQATRHEMRRNARQLAERLERLGLHLDTERVNETGRRYDTGIEGLSGSTNQLSNKLNRSLDELKRVLAQDRA